MGRVASNKKIAICKSCKKEYYPSRNTLGIYCSNPCQVEFQWNLWKNEVEFTQDASNRGILQIKRYLEETRGHKCEMCGLVEWGKLPILLICDHVDGNSDNWKLNNLRLICSNCDTLTPTYKGRNKGNGRFNRRQKYKEGKSY
jgi:5-methylcytosine-specific restriction endonuclease McrA